MTTTQVPAGARVRFHVSAPLASNLSKTGQAFRFVLIDPILVDGRLIAAAGAIGDGTVILAGHAGMKGHEGDLTLRIDSVPTTDGGKIDFDNQRFEINGVNEKAASAIAGFIPFVGFFAQFMRGEDIHLEVTRSIETVLLRPARIVARAPCDILSPGSSPTPAAAASAAPTAVPSTPMSPMPIPSAVTPSPCPAPAVELPVAPTPLQGARSSVSPLTAPARRRNR